MKKRPAVKTRASRVVIRDSELLTDNYVTMGGRKNKRGKPAEAHGGSPTKKKGGLVNKDTSEEKIWGR